MRKHADQAQQMSLGSQLDVISVSSEFALENSVTLYLGDCLEFLQTIPDESVQLVGHLACKLPFLYNGFASPNWSTGTGTGATQSVPSLAATRPTCCSFATPLERRGVTIPAACCSLQPINDLSWRGRMLAIQGTAFQDALDRFGHIQPGTA